MEKIQCRPYSLKNKDSMSTGMKTKKKPKRNKLPDIQLFYKKNTVKTKDKLLNDWERVR